MFFGAKEKGKKDMEKRTARFIYATHSIPHRPASQVYPS
jgi:hypothetical protein